MTLPRHVLLRFALFAVAGVPCGLLLAWATGLYDLQRAVTAILMGVAAWLAPIRNLPGTVAAVAIAVLAFMGLFILPLFFLLDGSFNPISNQHLAHEALRIAAIFALPVLAGAGISRYLTPTGDHR